LTKDERLTYDAFRLAYDRPYFVWDSDTDREALKQQYSGLLRRYEVAANFEGKEYRINSIKELLKDV